MTTHVRAPGGRGRSSANAFLMVLSAGLLVTGCGIVQGSQATNDAAARMSALASERTPGLVGHIEFSGDWLDGDSVSIALVSGATNANARQVWCDVVYAALPPDSLSVTVHAQFSDAVWPSPTDCRVPEEEPTPQTGSCGGCTAMPIESSDAEAFLTTDSRLEIPVKFSELQEPVRVLGSGTEMRWQQGAWELAITQISPTGLKYAVSLFNRETGLATVGQLPRCTMSLDSGAVPGPSGVIHCVGLQWVSMGGTGLFSPLATDVPFALDLRFVVTP